MTTLDGRADAGSAGMGLGLVGDGTIGGGPYASLAFALPLGTAASTGSAATAAAIAVIRPIVAVVNGLASTAGSTSVQRRVAALVAGLASVIGAARASRGLGSDATSASSVLGDLDIGLGAVLLAGDVAGIGTAIGRLRAGVARRILMRLRAIERRALTFR